MNILVVEDDDIHYKYFSQALIGNDVQRAATLADAVNSLKKQKPAIVILDAVFPESPRSPGKYSPALFSAEKFLDALQEISTSPSVRPDVLLVSGQEQAAGEFERIEQWLHRGQISDVLPKAMANAGWPFFCAVLKHRINRLARERSLEVELEQTEAFKQLQESAGIFTKSDLFLKIFEIIRRAAAKMPFASVLIQGPTGAGKELIALAFHKQTSPSAPFKVLLSTAIPANLAETALFGAVRGAYTDAESRAGFFEAAGKGTVFIDEIGDLPLELQGKLLRVLESRKFQRVGATEETQFGGRVVAATNRDLERMVSEGKFREDLFYRLNTIYIKVPALKDHMEDVPLLLDTFLAEFNRLRDDGVVFKEEVYEAFQGYDWPGNVRELRGAVELLVGMSSGVVGLEDVRKLLPKIALPPLGDPLVESLHIPGVTSWAALNDSHVAKVCEAIRAALNARGGQVLNALYARLEDPARGKNPRSIHVYKLLLRLSGGEEIDMAQITPPLGLSSWGQRDKVTALAVAPEGLAVLRVDNEGRRKYRIRPELLAKQIALTDPV